jgi:hypothetical protein
MSSKWTSLRRSCQGCVKVKRRCDLLFPQCTRCLEKGIACHYINVPLGGQARRDVSETAAVQSSSTQHGPAFDNRIVLHRRRDNLPSPTDLQMKMEIPKTRKPEIIQLIVDGMRGVPVSFARDTQALFIHPRLYETSLPRPVQEMHTMCNLCLADDKNSPSVLHTLVEQRVACLIRYAKRAASFEELLACVQALILAQCIRLRKEDGDEQSLKAANATLLELARKLWQQAPYQLPSSMSPWRAWIFAESVRRTIIICYLLNTAFVLNKERFALRSPFVDALPFDIRTWLWNIESEDAWTEASSNGSFPMVSLYEYTSMLLAGQAQGTSLFEKLVFAACKGKELPLRSPPFVTDLVH